MDFYGGNAQYIAPWLIAGGPKGQAVALGLTVAQWAAKNNCSWDSDPGDPCANRTGCQESKIQTENYALRSANSDGTDVQVIPRAGWQILGVDSPDPSNPNDKSFRCNFMQYNEAQGKSNRNYYSYEPPAGATPSFYLAIPADECVAKCSPDEPIPPPGPLPPQNYTTEEGCELTLNLLGFGQDPSGQGGPVWLIEPAAESRAGGSVIGGCNFNQTVYYDYSGGGSGGGGGTTIPYIPGNDDNGKPFWQDMLEKAIPSALGNLAARAISQLFEAKLGPAEFEFVAPCNLDDEGKQEFKVYQMPDQNYQSRVLTQQAVIMEILQQHLNWKTPVCFGNDQAGKYWRSITFESTTYSDNSNSRLVKRFRYRSNTPGDVRQLAAHWAGFSWNTGPVIVKHTGSALGSPQVWASSVNEGQRVIQHAGREAGVDPNQTGKWTTGGVDSPRYGVQCTVVLKQVDGCWSATARQGPEGWPEAASVFPDLRGAD